MKRLLLCGLLLTLPGATVSAVPFAPRLTAVVNGNAIVLTWSSSGRATLGYRLDAGLSPGTTIASSTLGPITSFTAFPIPAGTYYIRVHAFDATGLSGPSNEVRVVVGGGGGPAPPPGRCSAAPAPPAGVAFTVTGNLVAIRWSSGDGCPNTTYILHAGSAPTLSNVTIANLGAATSVNASAPNGTYYVRLFAQNAFGSSPPSAEVVIVVGGAAPRPPGNADALFNQAVVLWNAGSIAEARALFRQVVEIDPGYANAYYFLGLIDVNSGDLRSAVDNFRAYLKLAPTGQYASQVTEFLRQLGFLVPL